MAVETQGEAWQLGWRITAWCAFGNSDGMRSIRSCICQYFIESVEADEGWDKCY
ncbi:hypothetical protein ABIF68_006154 [Bradyrhizobium japonicum]